MGYGDAPGVDKMYNRNPGPQVDTGLSNGAALLNREMNARQEYAAPSNQGLRNGQQTWETIDGSGNNPEGGLAGVPSWYNRNAAPPVKYVVPSEEKENMQRRSAIRTATGARRTDPITDREVEYLKTMEQQAELADFDRYVQTLIDPRKPGNMKFLMEIYPQFVERRIQQAHTDYEFAIKKQMIDQYGVNTFEDLHFLYMLDQGKIAGPSLSNFALTDSKYSAGALSPFHYTRQRKRGLRLPFASANFGESAGGRGDRWIQPDLLPGEGGKRHALAGNRTKVAMATSMYAAESGDLGDIDQGRDRIQAGRTVM